MRVSPVGFAFNSVDEVLYQAKKSAEVTHNHPEGIKGAQSVALAIQMARMGLSKAEMRDETARRFGYDMNRTIVEIRPEYKYNTTCQGSVPESIIAFLDSSSYEEAIVNAISLGGDADTMACIAGGIAESFYGGVPEKIKAKVAGSLDKSLMDVVNDFYATQLRREQ
jgi:ADP-ribosylglycohydrolase